MIINFSSDESKAIEGSYRGRGETSIIYDTSKESAMTGRNDSFLFSAFMACH